MNSITDIWIKNKKTIESKSISQILAFAGNGKLSDGNKTSTELRELLDQVPSSLLHSFAQDCLEAKFDGNGFALQDIINQVGIRLGFVVKYGLYRGRKGAIGHDGIWNNDGYSMVLEVKTTDTYRINLDTIADYRNRLAELGEIDEENSSILIVVGRDDTGDLEAQIRGSRHAWDIRLISTESLLKLLILKETFNDTRTIRQINEILKPTEYTRLDALIELIFLTSKDLQLDEPKEEITEIEENDKSSQSKLIRVDFRDACIERIQKHLDINFIKQSRIAFSNKEKSVGLICSISKVYDRGKNESYWFSLYPHQYEFLKLFPESYIAYGCGSPKKILLIPYSYFEQLVPNFLATESEDRMYYHVTIEFREKKFWLQQPKRKSKKKVDITEFLIFS